MKLKTEPTPEGEQTLVPGVDPIERSKAPLNAFNDAPHGSHRGQLKYLEKPCNHGLFSDDRNQIDLLDLLK